MYEQVSHFVKLLHNLYVTKSITKFSLDDLLSRFDIVNLMSNLKVKTLIGSLLYLYNVEFDTIPESIREVVLDVYTKRLYNQPEIPLPSSITLTIEPKNKYLRDEDGEFIEIEEEEEEIDTSIFTNDVFLDQMQVWYKPYFKEEFWDSNIKTFMEHFELFVQTRQSYFLYWSSLVNMILLFARINKCRFYVQTVQEKPFFVTPKTKHMVYFNYPKGYNANADTFDMEKYYYPSGQVGFPIYEIRFWYDIKDKLLQKITDAFDCTYENIYSLYKTFICFLHNNNNKNNFGVKTRIPKHLQYICSVFGSEADTNFSINPLSVLKNGSIRSTDATMLHKFLVKQKQFFDYPNGEHSTEQEIKILQSIKEQEFIYLSLLFPVEQKFARHEFTNFVPSTINPIYFVDTGDMDIISIIGHDLSNHGLMKRKLHFFEKVNKDEINQFIDNILSSGLETEIMLYIHGIFHEKRSFEPFTLANFNKRIKDVVNPDIPGLTSEMIEKIKQFLKSTYPTIFLGKKKRSKRLKISKHTRRVRTSKRLKRLIKK
jgi:hypothetical protein